MPRARPKMSDEWAPYESKMVRHQRFHITVIIEYHIFLADVPSRHAGQSSTDESFECTNESISLGTQ